ncbi:putative hydrolase of the HAD superfamily [Halopolyspora algeriensis]|uniref:Putative hydrolase of the HAD superfamily n=1 Tax=Halopolyspora algeriensis TaxID=1500506 RepID=A0A368VDD3_9ACTN|nr:HAD family hydrolase [Halopolyspora algeriensis]RCW39148.1 putative hydrolase of the HAD superfamily [Halopolyspora algeriensis]TQM56555.1 putative hydrolase of the HAD superfamily [Halopolyspora algeriensis]
MTSALEVSTPDELEQIKAVCLDIDDTLLDNERSSRRGLAALTGNDASWPVWRRTTEEHYARFVAGETDFDTMCRERLRAFFAAFGERLSEAEVVAREQVRMSAMQRAWKLFDDAAPCLEWLRASGLRVAVISNAPGPYQRKKIASVGLADVFDELVLSGEFGVAKPDRRIFAAACSALGLRPEEVAHVGDRLDQDALGATHAGMHGVWLNRRDTARRSVAETPPEGVSTITGLDELPELLVCDLPAASLRGASPRGACPGSELLRSAG